MPVTMKAKKMLDAQQYLNIVVGEKGATALLKHFNVAVHMYAVILTPKDAPEKSVYVNTMVSSDKVLAKKATTANLLLAKSKIIKAAGLAVENTLQPISDVVAQSPEIQTIVKDASYYQEALKKAETQQKLWSGAAHNALDTSNVKVHLMQATKLGQPVKGTGANSPPYYLIAASDNIKIAARLNNSVLSVRVEGKPSTEVKKQMTMMGLDASTNHWSNHFELGPLPLERVLGSILYGLNESWTMRVDNAEQLKKAMRVSG